VWAPEAFFDAARGQYGIVWAGDDTTGTNHIYVSYVDDAFTSARSRTPEVLFDPGYGVVNPTLVSGGTAQYLFFEDATGTGSDIQVAHSQTGSLAPGSFAVASPQHITSGGALGPLVLSTPRLWYLLADLPQWENGFGVWSAPSVDADPSSWDTVPTTEYTVPRDAAQATAVRVKQAELDALVAHYGSGFHGSRIRATLLDGTSPQYVLHDVQVVLGPLDESGFRIGPDDYLWKVEPGLSDPSDTTLVSLESASRPGFYWRVRSATPNDWPAVSGGHYRDDALSAGSTTRFNHLIYLDRIQPGDATFAADATFHRTPALNGNATMSSFTWAPDPTLYVGYFDYHLVAQPQGVQGSTDTMSFAVEDAH